MEQSGLLAGAFERLSLFEVSLQPCRVQNTLSRDTIKLGSYWFLPKSDIRHTEHVKNFQIRFLIVYVFQKPTRITVLLSQFEKGAFGQSDTVSCQYFYFSLKNFILRTLMHKCARRRAFLVFPVTNIMFFFFVCFFFFGDLVKIILSVRWFWTAPKPWSSMSVNQSWSLLFYFRFISLSLFAFLPWQPGCFYFSR